MRIVNLDQFLGLPNDTVFCKYRHCSFGAIQIKTSNQGGESKDFYTQDLLEVKCSGSGELFNILLDAANHDLSFELDLDCVGRDGFYEKDQLYAVFEPADVQAIIKRLLDTLPSLREQPQSSIPPVAPTLVDERMAAMQQELYEAIDRDFLKRAIAEQSTK